MRTSLPATTPPPVSPVRHRRRGRSPTGTSDGPRPSAVSVITSRICSDQRRRYPADSVHFLSPSPWSTESSTRRWQNRVAPPRCRHRGSEGARSCHSPGYGPASAFDDDPNTEWIAPDIDNSVGQWISISFLRPIQLSSIVVTPKQGTFTITKVWITTDRGTVLRVLPPGRKSYRLSVAPGKSKHLRLTIAGVRVNHRGIERATGVVPLGAGISGISIPGISFEPRMLLPDDESATFSKPDAQPAVVSFHRPLSNENLSLSLSSTDDPNMARLFTVPESENVSGSGYAVPVPSESLNSLIAQRRGVPESVGCQTGYFTDSRSSDHGKLGSRRAAAIHPREPRRRRGLAVDCTNWRSFPLAPGGLAGGANSPSIGSQSIQGRGATNRSEDHPCLRRRPVLHC